MRELIRDFLNKLLFRNEGRPVPHGVDWQTFTVCDPNNLEFAINDIKDNGWVVKSIEYDKRFTYVLAYRERV